MPTTLLLISRTKLFLFSNRLSMISSTVKDAEIYTTMVDRTSDKNFREIKGILLRYLNKAGQIEEHAIDVAETKDRSAGLA